MLFFTPEILQYIIGAEYMNAQPLILVMTLAFFLYALTDIGTSSVFVPADKPILRAYAFGAMTAVTAIGIWIGRQFGSLGAAWAVLAGAIVSYVLMLVMAKKSFAIKLVTWKLAAFLVALSVCIGWLFTEPGLIWRIVVFVLFAGYMLYEAHKHELLPQFVIPWKLKGKAAEVATADLSNLHVICFAGSAYHSLAWTNRQQVMSRVAKQYPVLYVEPRVWLVRYLGLHWYKPVFLLKFLRRLFWYEKVNDNLFIKAQWNLIPGSREIKVISYLNHLLNRYHLLLIARYLGFLTEPLAVWVYDTEAIEYVSAFPTATVLYDCVDDHAAQAGVDRNSDRVAEEEKGLINRADVVTVTSQHLLNLKKHLHSNIHLVLNAGNVDLFLNGHAQTPQADSYTQLQGIPHPIIGSVGTIDSYKLDWQLVEKMARERPQWQFVFIGLPLLGKSRRDVRRLKKLPNIHFLGSVPLQEVPAYVRHFDVCFIPYRASNYNEASFPLKFWEFMATGKPIAVSGVPELKVYKPLIHYVKTSQDMIAAIEEALTNPQVGSAERIAEAKHHTWEKRVESLLTLLEAKVLNKK
jgi:hypothetical protein